MASEIRVNKITNRAGLSTVEYTDTGIVVSGISTFNGNVDINADLDVDGHTNLDNLSIAGVTTFGGSVNYPVGAVANFFDDVNFKGPSGRDIVFDKSHAELHFSDDTTIIMGTNDDLFITHDGTNPSILTKFGTLDIKTSQVAISTNMTVGGILTATTFIGDGSNLTGIAATTNVRTNSLEVSGVSTFTEAIYPNQGSYGSATAGKIKQYSNQLYIQGGTGGIMFANHANNRWQINSSGYFMPVTDSTFDIGDNTTRVRNIYADTYYGDGANLTNLPAGAPVGGASTNTVFFENDTAVAVNYQVTSGKNAMSAGPIAINAGIAVTVPSGSSWTIV